jgi:ABC-type dipeptide/oligopeptide/nickel transport system ATPase subunit
MRPIAATLNTLLKLANLELRPRGPQIRSLMRHPRLTTAGKIVELIGTQGIGKSTLNNDLYMFLHENWFFRGDLRHSGPTDIRSQDIEQLHREIYFRKIKHLKKKQADPWNCITGSQQMARVISENLTIMTHDFPRGFFLDEGLFKNFPREILKLDPERAPSIWKNRALIHLRARDPECVLSRYQSRAQERSSRGLLQRPPTDIELRERIQRDTDRFDQIMERALALGYPSLILQAEDNHHDNIGKILEFERELRQFTWPAPEGTHLQDAAPLCGSVSKSLPEKVTNA